MKVIHKYNLEELEQLIREYYQGMGYDVLKIIIESAGVTIEFGGEMDKILG